MIGRTAFWGDIIYSVGVSGFIYPIIGHWAWGPDGFLYTMGGQNAPANPEAMTTLFSSVGVYFHDFAGSTVVHSIGGWIALAGGICLGPRLGRKFKRDGGGPMLPHDLVMGDRGNGRLVYSTDAGRICSGCGWPARDCKCSQQNSTASVPNRIIAKLRVEKAGRGGKTVTVVDGLPHNDAFLKDLCQTLKRACGTGGAVREGAVELQGDLRDKIRALLQEKHFVVKG